MLWLSCEGQIDVRELFSDIPSLSAIFDRQGLLLVAAPVDLGTKKARSFSLLQGFLVKVQEKESQDCCDVTDRYYRMSYGNSAVCAWPWQSIGPLAIIIFLGEGAELGQIWWLKKAQYFQKKYHCQWTLLRGKKLCGRWISPVR